VKPPRLTPPPEIVPRELGTTKGIEIMVAWMDDPRPVRSSLPINPGTTDLPSLVRPIPDRVSTADPSAELTANRIVFTDWPLLVQIPSFVRFGIPDPFEWTAHLRGKIGGDEELGTTPVIVPPDQP
jgi:hypothetical protein